MADTLCLQVTEKIDDENQIDDAMINRARLQHDPNKMAAKQQQQAHADSKKLAQTLDNCQYCFENMTKHLIVAVHKNVCIGTGNVFICRVAFSLSLQCNLLGRQLYTRPVFQRCP